MPKKLLSEMSREELVTEMVWCQDEGKKVLEDGLTNQYQVLEQRYSLAKSYLMDPNDIDLHATYGLQNNTNLFIVNHLRGVFAYGKVLGEAEERGYPIGMLVPLNFESK